mmetsp:Transcript_96831/g.260384  ORF Transcript_96831/g.260384 Transcript_96831/m.260384 type:complete len:265 (-) Transcript_96831:116-910(-)
MLLGLDCCNVCSAGPGGRDQVYVNSSHPSSPVAGANGNVGARLSEESLKAHAAGKAKAKAKAKSGGSSAGGGTTPSSPTSLAAAKSRTPTKASALAIGTGASASSPSAASAAASAAMALMGLGGASSPSAAASKATPKSSATGGVASVLAAKSKGFGRGGSTSSEMLAAPAEDKTEWVLQTPLEDADRVVQTAVRPKGRSQPAPGGPGGVSNHDVKGKEGSGMLSPTSDRFRSAALNFSKSASLLSRSFLSQSSVTNLLSDEDD